MKHLMLDLETMGTASDAGITAIGAAFFDIKTGRVGETFDIQVNLQNEIDAGASVSAGTIQFWLSQPQGVAEKAMFKHPVKASAALDGFVRWVEAYGGPETHNIKLWGNGAVFDNVIIENAFRRHGIESPFKFWNHRDVRTVLDLSREMGYDAREETPFEGTQHVALDDVKHQVAYLSAAYRHITGKESNPGETQAGEWIKWDGTGVKPTGLVRVKFKCGGEIEEGGGEAYLFNWSAHASYPEDRVIVAYKKITGSRETPAEVPESDGWVEWNGTGSIPQGWVDLKFRGGIVAESSEYKRHANNYRWDHRSEDFDIVAYRKVGLPS